MPHYQEILPNSRKNPKKITNMNAQNKIQNYQYFFDDQVREAEREQKTIVKAPINQLIRKEEVVVGFVDHVNVDRGHVIIKFPKDKGPRLKVQKSLTIIKKRAFAELGEKTASWNCSLLDFCNNAEYHSAFSELMPLYYIRKNDSMFDYVGCSSVNVNLFELMKNSVASGKLLRVLVFTPFPPVDYFKNLNSYMEMNPFEEQLLIEPKIAFEDWHPEELAYNPDNESAIADTILVTLENDDVCILQGPPGTGKSYTIAQILAHYLEEGKTACVTTMANKGLIELCQQPPLREILEAGRISKTNLSADERRQVKGLKGAVRGLVVPNGELLCSTNYVLSHAFNEQNVLENGLPTYDIMVIEEASQAYLTSIVAFKSLGKKCLIVGDPMQLPPIVSNLRKSVYRTWNVNTQIEGLKTIALGTDIKSYRITTTFRLTPKSASLTGIFYDNRFTSVQKERVDFSKISSVFFPEEGGVLYHCTDDFTNGIYSRSALRLISDIINDININYPKHSLAIISPFKDTVKQLQKMFLTETSIDDFTIETIDRIQGMTVDYAILYIPGRNPGFALDERRFNVATSRSRSTTLVLADVPLTDFHSISTRIVTFLRKSKSIGRISTSSIIHKPDPDSREEIKFLYPGLEDIVDLLLENNIDFSHEGEVDLLDQNDVVLASAGMILKKYLIAIDPVDHESESVFEKAGYRVVDAKDFELSMLK